MKMPYFILVWNTEWDFLLGSIAKDERKELFLFIWNIVKQNLLFSSFIVMQ